MSLSSPRLELLLAVAERGEQELREALQAAEARQAELGRVLDELGQYLGEYDGRAMATVSPALLENRRQFSLRLQGAIAQQRRQVEEAAARSERARARWLAARREVQVTETLLAQARAEAQRGELRREQRELDEFALMRRQARAVSP